MKILLLIITTTTLLLSHSGRTDSNGGHYDRSSGEYHYHNGGYSNDNINQSYSSQYVLSIFQYKEFKGLGDTFDSKKECMDMRYKLWIENRDNGWTYGCRKK